MVVVGRWSIWIELLSWKKKGKEKKMENGLAGQNGHLDETGEASRPTIWIYFALINLHRQPVHGFQICIQLLTYRIGQRWICWGQKWSSLTKHFTILEIQNKYFSKVNRSNVRTGLIAWRSVAIIRLDSRLACNCKRWAIGNHGYWAPGDTTFKDVRASIIFRGT